MIELFIGLGIIGIGLAIVSWLLLAEKRKTEKLLAKDPAQEAPKTNPTTPDQLLHRLGMGNAPQEKPVKKKMSHFNLTTLFNKKKEAEVIQPSPRQKISLITPTPQKFGTAGLKLNAEPLATKESAQEIKNEEEMNIDQTQLKIKYEKLEHLLNEKNEIIDRNEKALAHEIKNRKEFNKVKDLLEKEVHDRKDHIRKLQIEVTSAQTEAQAYLKRVNQLEEKVKKVEKTVLEKGEELAASQKETSLETSRIAELTQEIQEKDRKIDALVKKLQPPHPSAAAVATVIEKSAPEAQIFPTEHPTENSKTSATIAPTPVSEKTPLTGPTLQETKPVETLQKITDIPTPTPDSNSKKIEPIKEILKALETSGSDIQKNLPELILPDPTNTAQSSETDPNSKNNENEKLKQTQQPFLKLLPDVTKQNDNTVANKQDLSKGSETNQESKSDKPLP